LAGDFSSGGVKFYFRAFVRPRITDLGGGLRPPGLLGLLGDSANKVVPGRQMKPSIDFRY
jgi:hypothetical protein